MNDPFDMDLKYLIKHATDQHGALNPVLALLIKEVMGHRTAQATSAERVRQVVLQTFAQLSEGIGVVVISHNPVHLQTRVSNYSCSEVKQLALKMTRYTAQEGWHTDRNTSPHAHAPPPRPR
jgi:hypothetical protein